MRVVRPTRGLVIIALLSAACGGAPPPALSPDARTGASVAALRQSVDALLAAPGLERATWGVLIRSADSGETLYARNPGSLLLPASGLKVATLAAAADHLGWDHVFQTAILGVGAIDFGFLDGDLVVVGSGDPSIDDWDGAATTLFGQWAARLKALGVRTVGGRIIGDDNAFDDEALGVGWTWEDLGASYAAGVGALQINQNSARLSMAPGAAPGDAAVVEVEPAWSGLAVDSAIVTGRADAPVALAIRRLPGDTRLQIRGTIPAGAARLFRTVSVDNPTLYFVEALRRVLVAQGIEIRGEAVDIDTLSDAPSRDEGVPLVAHRSPPLRVLAATMMKDSQNLYAETLLKAIGAGPATAGTTSAGREAAVSLMGQWAVPEGSIQMADGSGLSRYNVVAPEALVSILEHVHRSDYLREPYQAALPVAGRDGTLARRMAGTPAEGNAVAKTGSMSNTRTLAGYVRTRNGESIVFAIMANNFGSAGPLVESTTDAIVIALAQFSRR